MNVQRGGLEASEHKTIAKECEVQCRVIPLLQLLSASTRHFPAHNDSDSRLMVYMDEGPILDKEGRDKI